MEEIKNLIKNKSTLTEKIWLEVDPRLRKKYNFGVDWTAKAAERPPMASEAKFFWIQRGWILTNFCVIRYSGSCFNFN